MVGKGEVGPAIDDGEVGELHGRENSGTSS